MVAFEPRREYWYLCATTGQMRFCGRFDNYSDCEQTLEEQGKEVAFIFSIDPNAIGEEILKKTRDIA